MMRQSSGGWRGSDSGERRWNKELRSHSMAVAGHRAGNNEPNEASISSLEDGSHLRTVYRSSLAVYFQIMEVRRIKTYRNLNLFHCFGLNVLFKWIIWESEKAVSEPAWCGVILTLKHQLIHWAVFVFFGELAGERGLFLSDPLTRCCLNTSLTDGVTAHTVSQSVSQSPCKDIRSDALSCSHEKREK